MKGLSCELMDETKKALYELPIHHHKQFDTNGPTQLDVVRVPGGWIYQYVRLDARSMWAVFVPFNNEFQP